MNCAEFLSGTYLHSPPIYSLQMASDQLNLLLSSVRSCTICADDLPEGPRPIVQVGSNARINVIGQAPGRRVHESGIAWHDPSGDRLRSWLGLSIDQFYDSDTLAILPMGFCFPGTSTSGDKPPRPECAPTWHPKLLDQLPARRLDIIIGTYAQRRYIVDRPKTLTETVAKWRDYLPSQVVLPHPSPRNNWWLKKNPWFEKETIPAVREIIHAHLPKGA